MCYILVRQHGVETTYDKLLFEEELDSFTVKGKAFERERRKATGLRINKSAGLPGKETAARLFLSPEASCTK